MRQVSRHVDFTGHLVAAQTAEVRTRVTGHLAKVLFKPGVIVKQGEVLFELDSAPFQAALGRPEADVRIAQVRLDRATAELKELNSPHAPAPAAGDRQRLEAQQAEAQANLLAARGELEVARLNLQSTRLTAPIGGKIGRPLVAVGSLVTDGMSLATIDSVDPMCAAFDVDQATLLKLRRDPAHRDTESEMPVLVGLSDEKGYPRKSKVESADTRLGPTGAARWQALLPNPDGLLMPGMTVHVRLVTSDPYRAMLVPQSAMFPIYFPPTSSAYFPPTSSADRKQSFAVFIVTDHDVVQQREIQTGDPDDEMQVVEKGLNVDDWVIEKGSELYYHSREWRDGMTVKPQRKPPEAPPSSSQVAPPAAGPSAELDLFQGKPKPAASGESPSTKSRSASGESVPPGVPR